MYGAYGNQCGIIDSRFRYFARCRGTTHPSERGTPREYRLWSWTWGLYYTYIMTRPWLLNEAEMYDQIYTHYRLRRGAIPWTYRKYISVGDRVRPPGRGYYAPSALGEERVGVIDCGPSLGGYINPDDKYLCTRFQVYFCHCGILCHHRL